MAVTRTGVPIRAWCWPGNQGDQPLIRQVKDELREWKLARVVWVADRGFSSAENRRYLQRAGGHYIIGEKLRGDQAEAKAALSRQGRYRTVAGNLEVKEVVLDDGTMRDRFVICRNPEQADRDRQIREQLVAQLSEQIAGTDTLSAAQRDRLTGTLSGKRGSSASCVAPRAGCSASTVPRSVPKLISTASSCSAAPTPPSAPRTSRWATSSCCKSSAAGAISRPRWTSGPSTTEKKTASALTSSSAGWRCC
jgi:hypothetical protein